eukprot:CAMPEP_0118951864 /NCGR_PEP_ID=MMETSP1169-20130426/53839_1 /TAXON_ID=36882 /ORGANISM="Pyramimonas obovata, Strain CCMP722" /LENGTH=207 /DNA_ID=CAMNT_0006899003 /DNA_START=156 /DNA_END=775 /DNA_ORIENTATION=+
MPPKRGRPPTRAKTAKAHAEASERSGHTRKKSGVQQTNAPQIPGKRRGRPPKTASDAHGTAEEKPPRKRGRPSAESGPKSYFESKKASTKGKKSSAEQPKLRLQLVPEQRLRTILSQLPVRHTVERVNLLHSYETQFSQWHTQLRCGFSLLMYGVGSKKGLIQSFATRTLTDGAVVVTNGYFPSLSLKEVVYTVAYELGCGIEEELR